MAPNGAPKRAQNTPAVPRVIPAIPHALNKHARDKQSSQRPQPSHSVKPTETSQIAKAVETVVEELDTQDDVVPVDGESNIVTAPVDPESAASESEGTSRAAVSKADATVDDQTLPSSSSETIPPAIENVPGNSLGSNGVQGTEAPTSGPTATEDVSQSPSSQRPVRDLPPPFYPASQQSGPPSVASAQYHQEQQSTGQAAHQARPSANSLTFGGYRESANSSPAMGPPHPQNTMYSALPGHTQGLPPYNTSAHGYHISDPHAGPMYPPNFSPGPPSYGNPRDYGNNVPSHSRPYHQPAARLQQGPRRHFDPHMPQRYPAQPMQNMYLPQHVPPRPIDMNNQMSKSANSDVLAPKPNMTASRFTEQQPGAATNPSGSRQPDFSATARQDSSPMAQYLRGQFGNAEFADYVVQLSHSGYLFPPTMLPAHGVILARSPKLRSLITMQHGNVSNVQNNPKQLSVPISDRFLNFEIALMKALMRLYGEPLPEREVVARLAGPSAYLENGNVQAVQMRFALAYAAAGHFLQMDEIISHGLHLAESLLGWDTIGKALAFGLEGGLSASFSQFDTFIKDKESSSSVDDTPGKLDSPSSAPAYGYYSDRMLTYVVNFLVYNCPTDFQLSSGASQMNDPPRLPADAEPKHSRSTSRLSQIRFGEMTLDNSNSPDPTSEKMSSVILSLPFALLTHVLESNILGERLGWTRVAAIMRDAVQERELRRQRAMKNISASAPASAVEERLWRTVKWVESVEPNEQRPTGLKLSRHLAGDETPPSAGSVAN